MVFRKTVIVLILFFSIIISINNNALALQFSEVMFNPEGSDTGREWIEMVVNETDDCVNLTQYKLYEENTNHNIYPYAEDIVCGYAVICNDVNKFLQDYPYINSSIGNYSIYKSSFSLSNSGELLALKHDAAVMDELNYTSFIRDENTTEGHSIEIMNGTLTESKAIGGTPGYILIYTHEVFGGNGSNTTENSTSGNFTDISGGYNSTDITVNNGTENNASNSTSPTKLCNVSIDIIIKNESEVYNDSSTIKFYNKIIFQNTMILTDVNYSIEYWVEDLFGNIIKNPVNTSNQNEKSFTPKIDEKDKVLLIKNIIRNINCEITGMTAEKMIIIKNEKYIPPTTNCPASKCAASKCEQCTCKEYSGINYTNDVRVINDCENATIMIKTFSANALNTNYLGAQSTATPKISESKNVSNTTNKITASVIYESPNQKNKAYAVVGIIILALIGLFYLAFRLYSRKMTKDTPLFKR